MKGLRLGPVVCDQKAIYSIRSLFGKRLSAVEAERSMEGKVRDNRMSRSTGSRRRELFTALSRLQGTANASYLS